MQIQAPAETTSSPHTPFTGTTRLRGGSAGGPPGDRRGPRPLFSGAEQQTGLPGT